MSQQPLNKNARSGANGVLLWALRAAVDLGLISSIYTVEAESEGGYTVQSPEGQRKPGLHFKLPFGIDEVYALPVERQLK